ncbi:MAG: metallopeptidase family protein [Candidatus Pacebacteria bacterium]|nr:metallopeptidase family protein [Candidatus Paceibacterota bacterium]
MTMEEFEKLVDEGIKDIPEHFLKMLENVDIIIEETPTIEQLEKLKIRKGVFLFGLYEGIPQTKRWGYSQALPDKITIFKNPIEKVGDSDEEIKKIVRDTIWHELAHHFGMDEKSVRDAEKRKKIT